MAIRWEDAIGLLEVLDGRAALIRSFAQDSRFEFLPANLFTRLVAVTLPVGISKFITEKQILWGYITAAATLATLATLPPVVLLWFFQRHLLRGLTFGAVR